MSSSHFNVQQKPAYPQSARTADRTQWDQHQSTDRRDQYQWQPQQGNNQGRQDHYGAQQDVLDQYQYHHSSHRPNMAQMQVKNPVKTYPNSWASRVLSQIIAITLAIVSLVMLILGIQGIMRVQEARRLLSTLPTLSTTGRTSWTGSSSSDSTAGFDNFAKGLNDKLDETWREALIYAYVLTGISALQLVLSLLGFAGVTRRAINMYKVYVYATGLFLLAWVVLAALSYGQLYLVLCTVAHLAVAFPLWAGLKRWESMAQDGVEY